MDPQWIVCKRGHDLKAVPAAQPFCSVTPPYRSLIVTIHRAVIRARAYARVRHADGIATHPP